MYVLPRTPPDIRPQQGTHCHSSLIDTRRPGTEGSDSSMDVSEGARRRGEASLGDASREPI